MNRTEQLSFCRVCKHRKLDPEGEILCSITNLQADFKSYCDNYQKDRKAEREIKLEQDNPNDHVNPIIPNDLSKLNEHELNKLKASVLAQHNLYKAGESIDYKRHKNQGALGIIAGLFTGVLSFSNEHFLSGFGAIIIGIYFGQKQFDKGKKQEEALKKYGLIQKNKKED